MHPKNIHQGNYDLAKLGAVYPILKAYIFTNNYGVESIDFSKPDAVKALNTALLKLHHDISFWEFPDSNLCPPIPSRADYLYYLNNLLKESDFKAKKTTLLDIGTGATCIYPLLGNSLFNWQFVASDISEKSLENAQKIIVKNSLTNAVRLRKQSRKKLILEGVIQENDYFFASMCNPPFYKNKEKAEKTAKRKLRNLGLDKNTRNFAGKSNELWYKGGEVAFIKNYIKESVLFQKQVYWFTSLVSKSENLPAIHTALKQVNPKEVRTIEMKQGNKITRFIAWRF
jgi:23S rRNA (adenine1618-N6)-methyltransferase